MINKDLRDKIFKEFSKYLGNSVAKEVELALFKFSQEYAEENGTPFLLEQIYESKSEELIHIFKGKSLKYIIDSIKNKTIVPDQIPYMRKSELISDISNKNTKIDDTNKGSDLFLCSKCKKRNTTIEEKQIRAADEPATQFITCLECGNSWTL